MFIYLLVARDPWYVVGAFRLEERALAQRARWLRRHPAAQVEVERYTLLD